MKVKVKNLLKKLAICLLIYYLIGAIVIAGFSFFRFSGHLKTEKQPFVFTGRFILAHFKNYDKIEVWELNLIWPLFVYHQYLYLSNFGNAQD